MRARKLVAVTFSILVSSAWSGCGSGDRGGSLANGLTLSGNATLAGGASLAGREFPGQILLIVEGASAALGSKCPRETQHRASVVIRPEADGSYQLTLTPRDFAPVSHVSCPLSALDDANIRALRMSVNSSIDPGACEGFCDATAGASDCIEGCSASGQLRAQERARPGDFHRLERMTTLVLPLRFDEVAPAAGSGGMPDLQVDASSLSSSVSIETREFKDESCAFQEGCLGGLGARKLMTFDGIIANNGSDPLVVGDPEGHEEASFDACHAHYHLGNLMTYELLSADGAIVATGRKQGFCLMDSTQMREGSPGTYTCENQGISAGWADVYDRALDCQWVDVTDVDPGQYLLKLKVNPELEFLEADYSNNEVQVPVTIPGEVE